MKGKWMREKRDEFFLNTSLSHQAIATGKAKLEKKSGGDGKSLKQLLLGSVLPAVIN